LEKPKLKDYKEKMRQNVATLLNTSIDNVSIKAGTNEGLDDIGHSLAIKVDAIVLLNER
ncbi:MAG: 2-C-methyl-D-erythritol 2,4-cyclodiphosphate synthase, partial [Bacilli bacterium]|nr:2-C-methyl-D-erythritol 2,4-cyclodiphosphate synthase [Bacilli bacterium]